MYFETLIKKEYLKGLDRIYLLTLKFMFSKKATKNYKIFNINLTLTK